MKFFLDTANVEEIKKAVELGVCDGVTTNPTLIMKSGKDQKSVIKEIAKVVHGPISVEGIADDADGMVRDGEEFAKWAPNIVVKVPMTKEGLKAVRMLEAKGIKTNVTLARRSWWRKRARPTCRLSWAGWTTSPRTGCGWWRT